MSNLELTQEEFAEQEAARELARQQADEAARAMIESEDAARLPSPEQVAQEAEWEAIIVQARKEAEELSIQRSKEAEQLRAEKVQDAEEIARVTGVDPQILMRLLDK